jgi:dipeptidyl aminopeptidase/acylaminoacyl peptidase/CubicO group peptidase (beta-lactamase class C family)
MRIADLPQLAVPLQPALAPDGRQVAYVLRTLDAAADQVRHQLWVVAGGAARRLTTGRADTCPAWSPDGTRLAFLRATGGATGGAPQLWSLPVDGGEPAPVTTLPLGAGAPVWSPDGSRIAFAAPVDLRAAADEDAAARARRDGAPIVSDRVDYHADGAGYLRSLRRHLHVVDVGTGTVRQVTDGDWSAGDPAWSPDGRRLAFAAAMGPDRDLSPRAGAYVLDVDDQAARPRLAGLGDGVAGPVGWTADGDALLVVGHPGEPTGHVRLLRVPLGGGAPVDLAAALDRNVMPGGPGYPGGLPQLVDGGASVLFCVRDRGCTHVYAVPVTGGEPRPVLAGAGRVVSGLSAAAGVAAVALATPTSFGEIVTLDLATGTETVRTDHGEPLARVELYPRVEREFSAGDGAAVPAWIVRDPERTGPTPLLLDMHGGPHNAWNAAADEVHLYHQELVARGWTVLLVNPRGSDGYGEAFYRGVDGRWGEADAGDFLAPVDALVAEGVADPGRLAVTGYSYGGYMTCYLTSRDDRFAAAVAGGVVSDLVSMAGTSAEGAYLSRYELGGTPCQLPDRYAAMSPLTGVANVRTPTLVLHGADDRTCPVGQAQQWHTALRERGIPARLVVYPGGSHLFILDGPPSHRMDYGRRVVDWVEQYAAGPTGPRRAPADGEHWQRRLAALAARHRVPGAVLGILRVRPDGTDDLVTAAYGVLNTATGAAATADSVFQIGSITKVWTATVAMQLVEEGRLHLDAPVAEVLPELRLADPDVTKRVTLRHLLNHTSGIDGDIFTDTGRGDDCLERYVAQLDAAAQNHPIGATWSYCNSGFVLIGRMIEKVTGTTWDAAMRERLFTPLGLARTGTLPEEALLHRAAVGHLAEGDADPAPAPVWGLPRSLGPAGLISAAAADVLAFARLHLTGGLAPDGTRLLGEAAAAELASRQADLPDRYSLGDSWGLGWIRFGWDGHRLVGHDGNTLGQAAFLRLLPEQGLAVTLLTNGGHSRDLYEDLYRELFAELAGVAMPRPIAPPPQPVSVDITPHVGRYERAGVLLEVLAGEDGPRLRTTLTGPLAALVPDPVEEHRMVPVGPDLFVVRPEGTQTWAAVTFYGLPTGERYLHFGVRATPRVS